jgi:integrase
MRVAFLTGWRAQSELLTRQWKDVDLTSGWLRLEAGQSKNGRAREFPLDTLPELREILERQRERARLIQNASGMIVNWVFFYNDGRQIKDYRGAWASACEKAGYGGMLVHDLRRSAVRSLEAAGVSRSSAMELTGHLTESVYRRYAVVDQDALRQATRKIAEYHAREREQLAATGPKVGVLPTFRSAKQAKHHNAIRQPRSFCAIPASRKNISSDYGSAERE